MHILVALLAIASADGGWIQTKLGKDIFWEKTPVHMVLTSTHCQDQAELAARYINLRSGRDLIVVDDPLSADIGYPAAIMVYGEPAHCDPEGCTLVTQHYVENDATGEVRGAIVYVPHKRYCAANNAWWAIAHEFGHVLGLHHNAPGSKTLMSPTMDATSDAVFPDLSLADVLRLIVHY